MPRAIYEKNPVKYLKSHGFKRRSDGVWTRDNGSWTDWCKPEVMSDGKDFRIEINTGNPPNGRSEPQRENEHGKH